MMVTATTSANAIGGNVRTGINTEIYSSIQDIARVTPDLKLADREGMCRAIATLCELGMRLEEQERANGGLTEK